MTTVKTNIPRRWTAVKEGRKMTMLIAHHDTAVLDNLVRAMDATLTFKEAYAILNTHGGVITDKHRVVQPFSRNP